MEKVIGVLLIFIEAYLSMGLLFSIYFLYKGINKIDEGAQRSPITFKLLITPGVIVFWIILLRKLIKQKA